MERFWHDATIKKKKKQVTKERKKLIRVNYTNCKHELRDTDTHTLTWLKNNVKYTTLRTVAPSRCTKAALQTIVGLRETKESEKKKRM